MILKTWIKVDTLIALYAYKLLKILKSAMNATNFVAMLVSLNGHKRIIPAQIVAKI